MSQGEEVFCLHEGDDIECGCSLVSLHESLDGALTAAKELIARKELPWVNQPDRADWTYISAGTKLDPPNLMRKWRTNKGYDIVLITCEVVGP